MIPNSVMTGTDLLQLGSGAQFSLFGFRACALGETRCDCLAKAFRNVLGDDKGDTTLALFHQLVLRIGEDGTRRLKLVSPGCSRISFDEASILGAFAASQAGDEALRDAHLSWLLACAPDDQHRKLCDLIGRTLAGAGMTIVTPETLTPGAGTASKPSSGLRLVAGNA